MGQRHDLIAESGRFGVVARFDLDAQVPRTGILIGGRRGQPVLAAAAGEVVYSGSGLKGYGKLIIARQRPRLHFEIRRDGQPVDPMPLLSRGG